MANALICIDVNQNGSISDYCSNTALQGIRSVEPIDTSNSRRDRAQIILSINGDRQAFELLFRRWQPRWLKFANWLVQDQQDALDVTQEACIAIARNIHKLKDPAMFKPWSFTIVRRRAADHVRGAINARKLATALQQEPEPEALQPDANTTLDDLLSLVDSNDQQLLTLFYVYGLSVAELASILQIATGTVKSRLFNARGRLQRAYENEIKGNDNE